MKAPDFRREFNQFVENQREVRASMFELFAMDVGTREGDHADAHAYWQARADRLRQPRSRVVRLHTNPFWTPMTAYQLARAGKRPRKQAMKRAKQVIVRAEDLHKP